MLKILKFLETNKRPFFYLALTIIVCALFWPMTPGDGMIFFDKVAHVSLFTFFSFFAFMHTRRLSHEAVLASLLFFAIASEFIQEWFIVGRGYEFFDIVADFIGIAFGFAFAEACLEFLREEKKIISKKKIVRAAKKTVKKIRKTVKGIVKK